MTAEDETRRLPDAEVDALLDAVDAAVEAMTPEQRAEHRLEALTAVVDMHPGTTRRVFRRGPRIAPCVYGQGDAEPNPPVPVRSILLHWQRHPDGLWRAANLHRAPGVLPVRYAYTWRLLLNSFPQLTEVLPTDPPPREYQAR